MGDSPAGMTRRPIRARDTRWARATAAWLARTGFRPNGISLLSSAFAALAGAAFALQPQVHAPWGRVGLYAASVLAIQMRLLCNLFDGMVAVEGGFRTKAGEVYNELPDRFSDLFIFVGAGHSGAAFGPTFGWCAAALAVLTAYVRAMGGAAGLTQSFAGPMAKQHRMALATLACVAASVECLLGFEPRAITVMLCLVCAGCLVTVFRRAAGIVRELSVT